MYLHIEQGGHSFSGQNVKAKEVAQEDALCKGRKEESVLVRVDV